MVPAIALAAIPAQRHPEEHPLRLSDAPPCLLHAFWLDCDPSDPDCPVLLDAEIRRADAEAKS